MLLAVVMSALGQKQTFAFSERQLCDAVRAVNPGHAKPGEQAVLMLVIEIARRTFGYGILTALRTRARPRYAL